MKILTDIHCHTIASTHAYSTVLELARAAADKEMEAVAVTDHGLGIPDAPHLWHFINLKVIPREIYGIKILRGCEANIMGADGRLDMDSDILKTLDLVIASIHAPCFPNPERMDCTQTYLNALENPYVDIIGHSGSPNYPYDHERVLLKARELHKMIEINAHSFSARKGSIPNCRKLAEKCKELGVSICVNSDAHFAFEVGAFDPAIEMLRSIDFPEELIANRSYEALRAFLKPRKELFI